MTVNYLLVFSFFLYGMYMNLYLVYDWLSSVISYLNYSKFCKFFHICFVDDRSNLQGMCHISLSTAFYRYYMTDP